MAQWLVIDPDRFAAAARIMAVMWLAYLGYIYIDGIPAGTAVVSAAAPLGMALSVMPQLRVSKLVVPVATGVLIAGIAYIFVMPHLSHFAGLGLLIFSITFAMCYWFAKPQQMLGRAFGLAMFVLIAGISNEQTYSFVGAATTALLFPTIFLILAITAYIPYSPRPERAFMRLLGRFFRSCEYLTSTMEWDPAEPLTKIRRVRKNFHTREVTTLPAKLAVWSKFIDPKALPGTTPENVQALLVNIRSISRRMLELQEERANPQSELVVREMREDIREWRIGVQGQFQRLGRDPSSRARDNLRDRLDEQIRHIESRIIDMMNKVQGSTISEGDAASFYRLLGVYRSVSEALVEYSVRTDVIDWTPWREERFA